jgi:hypothetical protein
VFTSTQTSLLASGRCLKEESAYFQKEYGDGANNNDNNNNNNNNNFAGNNSNNNYIYIMEM